MSAVRPTPEGVIAWVVDHSHYDHEQLVGPRRWRPLVQQRFLAMYLIRQLTDLSYPEIGRLFNRDHTTVMHGVGKVESQLRANWNGPMSVWVRRAIQGLTGHDHEAGAA